MSRQDIEVLNKSSPSEETSRIPYNLVQYNEQHQRPTGFRSRIHDSVSYTYHDIQKRFSGSFNGFKNSIVKTKNSVLKLPSNGPSYIANSVRFYWENPTVFRKELLSGITVALLQVPESVAFSYVAGLPDPLFGLYATVFLGSITAAFGGKPGMISGAAGALAVVMKDLTSPDGPLKDLLMAQRIEHLLMTVIFVGIFQMAFGLLGLSKFVNLIPSTAMIGFMNGLAIIIFMAQLPTFEKCTVDKMLFEECSSVEKVEWMSIDDPTTWMVLFVIALTMFIVHYFPKVPKIGGVIPASLVAVVVGTAFEFGINRPFIKYNIRTVQDTAPIGGELRAPHIPDLGESSHWSVIISYAARIAAIGIFEAIMTLQAVNEITKTSVTISACSQETIAQGLANIVAGIFQSMGGGAMIGQSSINVMNGARFRLSGFIAGIFMLIIIVVASKAIRYIPVACLTGILFMVVIHTFHWPTFKLMFRLHLVDVIAILIVTILAVVTDLAIAVVAGVIWQSLVSVWENGKLLRCSTTIQNSTNLSPDFQKRTIGENSNQSNEECIKIYHIVGPLLFGSTRQFRAFFDVESDPNHVIVDLEDALVCDFSAVVSIREIALRYRDAGKRMTIRHVCHRSQTQFHRDRDWVVSDYCHRTSHKNLPDLEIFHADEVPAEVNKYDPQILLEEMVQTGELEEENNDSRSKLL